MVNFCFVRLAQQRRQNVRGSQVEVIVRAVQICRHGGNKVRPVLAGVSLTKLYSNNLGYRIGFVGGLKCAGEQRTFGNWLRRKLGINTRTAEKEQLRDATLIRSANHVV